MRIVSINRISQAVFMSLLSNSHSGSADVRLVQLQEWLHSTGLVQADSARPASADASFRRYFRIDVLPEHQAAHGATLIAMDAPPERENVPAFVKVDGILAAAGVSVPKIVADDVPRGFLLLSDLAPRPIC